MGCVAHSRTVEGGRGVGGCPARGAAPGEGPGPFATVFVGPIRLGVFRHLFARNVVAKIVCARGNGGAGGFHKWVFERGFQGTMVTAKRDGRIFGSNGGGLHAAVGVEVDCGIFGVHRESVFEIFCGWFFAVGADFTAGDPVALGDATLNVGPPRMFHSPVEGAGLDGHGGICAGIGLGGDGDRGDSNGHSQCGAERDRGDDAMKHEGIILSVKKSPQGSGGFSRDCGFHPGSGVSSGGF